MTTIKQVPSVLLKGLGLQKGDFLTVMDESAQTYVVRITTSVDDSQTTLDSNTARRAALSRFAAGVIVEEPSTEQELDDARFSDLRAKHLK